MGWALNFHKSLPRVTCIVRYGKISVGFLPVQSSLRKIKFHELYCAHSLRNLIYESLMLNFIIVVHIKVLKIQINNPGARNQIQARWEHDRNSIFYSDWTINLLLFLIGNGLTLVDQIAYQADLVNEHTIALRNRPNILKSYHIITCDGHDRNDLQCCGCSVGNLGSKQLAIPVHLHVIIIIICIPGLL